MSSIIIIYSWKIRFSLKKLGSRYDIRVYKEIWRINKISSVFLSEWQTGLSRHNALLRRYSRVFVSSTRVSCTDFEYICMRVRFTRLTRWIVSIVILVTPLKRSYCANRPNFLVGVSNFSYSWTLVVRSRSRTSVFLRERNSNNSSKVSLRPISKTPYNEYPYVWN